ncbi:MAG: DUF3152 domain-containing protein [Actinomycetota bacterium]
MLGLTEELCHSREVRSSARHHRRVTFGPIHRRRILAGLLVLSGLLGSLALVGDRDIVPIGALTARAAPDDVSSLSVVATRSATPSVSSSPAHSAKVAKAVTSPAEVPWSGSRKLVPVSGSAEAPGQGEIVRVRVEIEQDLLTPLRINQTETADFILATLNDERSWAHGDQRRFARTSGVADLIIVLATPETSAQMCQPLLTRGTLSCRQGDRAIITAYRWMKGTPEFADLTTYRRYVINHEVGHFLGRGHEPCPGKGKPAPLMQQQTKQVAPCRPNPWPYP